MQRNEGGGEEDKAEKKKFMVCIPCQHFQIPQQQRIGRNELCWFIFDLDPMVERHKKTGQILNGGNSANKTHCLSLIDATQKGCIQLCITSLCAGIFRLKFSLYLCILLIYFIAKHSIRFCWGGGGTDFLNAVHMLPLVLPVL